MHSVQANVKEGVEALRSLYGGDALAAKVSSCGLHACWFTSLVYWQWQARGWVMLTCHSWMLYLPPAEVDGGLLPARRAQVHRACFD